MTHHTMSACTILELHLTPLMTVNHEKNACVLILRCSHPTLCRENHTHTLFSSIHSRKKHAILIQFTVYYDIYLVKWINQMNE